MLTPQENDALTQVGPGTFAGNLMRRFWVPALLDWELPEPDCPPVRVKLLGEQLIAFRDTHGKVGVVDNYCPHRRASLFFGRNEESGLRCVYHGWKFDVNGDCLDMPSEPLESNFKDKVKIAAYPTAELGNVIWVYMGPPEAQPPLPALEWTQVPEDHRGVNKVVQKCNWLQGLEGGIDTVHINFLHRNLAGSGIAARDRAFARSYAARVEVVPTDYGYTYAGIRDQQDDNEKYVRAYHYIAPWTQLRPNQLNRGGAPRLKDSGHMWVPIDDVTTMVWNFTYTFGDEPLTPDERLQKGSGNELGKDIDVEAGFKSRASAENDYLIDREMQRTQTFTGIPGTNTQDRAVQDTMGPVCDRTREHLGTTDRAIIMARKVLLQAARVVEDGGDPPGLGNNVFALRSVEKVLPSDVHWRDALWGELYEKAQYTPEYVPA